MLDADTIDALGYATAWCGEPGFLIIRRPGMPEAMPPEERLRRKNASQKRAYQASRAADLEAHRAEQRERMRRRRARLLATDPDGYRAREAAARAARRRRQVAS